MTTLFPEARYGLRLLLKSPGLTHNDDRIRKRWFAAPIQRKMRTKMKRTIVIPALLLLAAAAAQTTSGPTNNPVSTALRNILPGRQKNTVAAVEAMPADKFNYKPTADQMTFGHLVVHIAETNDLLCSKAADVPAPKVDLVKETDSKDKLVAAVKASFDFCSDALAKMDDSRLAETTEIFPGRQGSRAWASMILAGAWADHYAETAMYLRLNGVLPPTAKK
jgi:DinB superfamily